MVSVTNSAYYQLQQACQLRPFLTQDNIGHCDTCVGNLMPGLFQYTLHWTSIAAGAECLADEWCSLSGTYCASTEESALATYWPPR